MMVLAWALMGVALLSAPGHPDAGTSPDTLIHPVTIKNCDMLSGKGKKSEWICTGNVQVIRDDAKISCDRMTAYYKGDQSQVTRALCDGHVVVVQPDRMGKGEHADFNNLTGVLVVTGHPELHQGRSVLYGEKATFFVDTNEFFMDRATGQIIKEDLRKADGGQAK